MYNNRLDKINVHPKIIKKEDKKETEKFHMTYPYILF